jgi:UbiD family decarboxylase
MALGVSSELKNVMLVDGDADIFDTNDVLWPMQTRMQGNRDIITIPGVAGHVLDPSHSPNMTRRCLRHHLQDHLRRHRTGSSQG